MFIVITDNALKYKMCVAVCCWHFVFVFRKNIFFRTVCAISFIMRRLRHIRCSYVENCLMVATQQHSCALVIAFLINCVQCEQLIIAIIFDFDVLMVTIYFLFFFEMRDNFFDLVFDHQSDSVESVNSRHFDCFHPAVVPTAYVSHGIEKNLFWICARPTSQSTAILKDKPPTIEKHR